MLTFWNHGSIDIRAATIMGVNVKETDEPIGMFGTGLKYSIAVLLRLGHKIKIYSGDNVYEFSNRSEEIRGKAFGLIYMNGQPLGFTTDLGKKWELWQVYRELYSNCKDENGEILVGSQPGGGDRTAIVVTGLDQLHLNRHEFLFTGPVHHDCDIGEVQFKPSNSLFYRGIKVYSQKQPFLFTYNILADIDLTEDRTAKYDWEILGRVQDIISNLPSSKLRLAITAPKGYVEHDMTYDSHRINNPGLTEIIGEEIVHNRMSINSSLIRLYEDHIRDKSPKEFPLSPTQLSAYTKAVAFCESLGFPISDIPVKFIKSLGPNVYGLARGKEIFITEITFDKGTKFLASTLIEEFIHVQFNYHDFTREFQDFILNRLVSFGEQIKGEVL